MSVTVHRTMYRSSTSLLLRPLQQRPLRDLINLLIPTATCSWTCWTTWRKPRRRRTEKKVTGSVGRCQSTSSHGARCCFAQLNPTAFTARMPSDQMDEAQDLLLLQDYVCKLSHLTDTGRHLCLIAANRTPCRRNQRARLHFCGRRQLAFAWPPHSEAYCGPAGNRTATGSLSATSRTSPYQLLHRDA